MESALSAADPEDHFIGDDKAEDAGQGGQAAQAASLSSPLSKGGVMVGCFFRLIIMPGDRFRGKDAGDAPFYPGAPEPLAQASGQGAVFGVHEISDADLGGVAAQGRPHRR